MSSGSGAAGQVFRNVQILPIATPRFDSAFPAAATGDTNPKMSLPEQAFSGKDDEIEGIRFVDYKDESQLERVMSLVGRDLSEPYSSEHCISVRCGFFICENLFIRCSFIRL